MTKAPKWRAPSGSRLHWRSWDDEFVVYDSASGDTHLLDSVPAETLKILERQSANLSELVDMVAASLTIEADSELSTYLDELLSQFEKLGLVEQVRT